MDFNPEEYAGASDNDLLRVILRVLSGLVASDQMLAGNVAKLTSEVAVLTTQIDAVNANLIAFCQQLKIIGITVTPLPPQPNPPKP